MTPSERIQYFVRGGSCNTFLLKPEGRICYEFVLELKKRSLDRSLPYIWFHVPNEFYDPSRSRGGAIFGRRLSQAGKLPGVADYCFISPQRSFFIEVKTKKGTLSPDQKLFKSWCEEMNVEYYICRSYKECVEKL
jgi:hypothetical protein